METIHVKWCKRRLGMSAYLNRPKDAKARQVQRRCVHNNHDETYDGLRTMSALGVHAAGECLCLHLFKQVH